MSDSISNARNPSARRRWLGAWVMALALPWLALSGAWAHDDEGERSPRGRTRVPMLAAYQQECSACHMAYPPGLLPAASWQGLMQGLPRHFGTDASLDPDTVKKVSTWLTDNAAPSSGRARPPQDRITRSSWFVHEHDELPPSVWQRASVRSAANCVACHAGAEQGDFNEHRVRIPR